MKSKTVLALISFIFLPACGPADPVPADALVWVNQYYITHPVGSLSPTAAGWLFRGAKGQNGEIRVGFLIPNPMNPDAKKRHAILEQICPLKTEKIWTLLPRQNKMYIMVWTDDKKFKDSVTC